MSTITRALLKRHQEQHQGGEDAESILERNAVYREAMRHVRPPAAGRLVFGLASLILGAILVSLLIAIPSMTRPRPPVEATTQGPILAASARPALAPPAPLPTPSPIPTPMLREEVRLRTQPPRLLKASAAAPEEETFVPALPPDEAGASVYAAGSQPAVSQPVIVLPVIQPPADTPRPSAPRSRTSRGSTSAARPSDDPHEFLSLTGIIKDPKNPTALIGDEIVRVGDVVKGARVLAIDNSSSVRVEYKGKEYTLYLK